MEKPNTEAREEAKEGLSLAAERDSGAIAQEELRKELSEALSLRPVSPKNKKALVSDPCFH